LNIYAYFVRGARHAALCCTSIESVRKADSRANFIVATDEPRRSWTIPGAAIHDFEPGMPIMLANLEAQCSILAANPHSSITFLDTDILMLEQLPATPGADITITWRDHALVGEDGEKVEAVAGAMPYNYGVLRAVANYASLEAFIWLRERIRRMSSQHQQWYGNQLALAQLAGPRPDHGMNLDTRYIPWMLTKPGNPVRIAKLPGERWNWTPNQVGQRLHGLHSILHFKGRSRPLMESYAKRLELTWHAEAA
jgi:hypothetical protein